VANVLAVAEEVGNDGPPYRVNEGRWTIPEPVGEYEPQAKYVGYDFCAPEGEMANTMGPVVIAGDKDKIRTMEFRDSDFIGEVDPTRINVLVAFSNFWSRQEMEVQYQQISEVLKKSFSFLPISVSGLVEGVPVGVSTRNLYGLREIYAPHMDEAGELVARLGQYDAIVVIVNSGDDKTTEGRTAGATFLGESANSKPYAVVVTGDKTAHVFVVVHELGHALGFLRKPSPKVRESRTALRDGIVGKTRTSPDGFDDNAVMILGDPKGPLAEAIKITGTKLVPSGAWCGGEELKTPSDPFSVMRDWQDNQQLAEVINAGGMVFARVEAFALQELWFDILNKRSGN
jgi:hypothetical protein